MTDFVKEAKLTELENKIPNVSSLATKTALATVENKIPDLTNLVNKTDNNTKVTEIENKLTDHNHDKYIDTQEFNKLAADVFKQIWQPKRHLILNYQVLTERLLKIKHHLIVQNKMNQLKTFDSCYFIGKNHFEEDGTQNYLVFQPIVRYFKVNTITNTDYVSSWKSQELSAESIKPPTSSVNSLTPELDYYGTKTRVKFSGSCLQQSKSSYTHSTIVNIYIVCKLGASGSHNNDPTLKNCLFGVVTLTKNADIDKYKYSGYGIGFGRRSSFSFPSGGFGQNILIFGVDMSSSVHIDNKKEYVLVLGKGPTQGLEHTLTAEKIRLILLLQKRNFV